MSDLEKKLEAYSLMRILPAEGAKVGDITRQELRDAELGTWVAPCGRSDDLRDVQGPRPSSPEDPRAMHDFDTPLPMDPRRADDHADDRVIVLSFKAG